MTIQRYSYSATKGKLVRVENGGIVLHTDHLAALQQKDEVIEAMAQSTIASLQRERECRAKLAEALEDVLPKLAHWFKCGIVRPSKEWTEHGSMSFDNCCCEISKVHAALASAKEME